MNTVVVKPTKAARQQKKKGKRPSKKPARARYWNGRHLEKNKIRHMMKAYGLTKEEARKRWNAERKTRVPTGHVSDYSDGKADTHKRRVAENERQSNRTDI